MQGGKIFNNDKIQMSNNPSILNKNLLTIQILKIKLSGKCYIQETKVKIRIIKIVQILKKSS